MPTLKLLLKELLKFLSALFRNISAAVVIALIGAPVLISWATGTLDILFQTIKSPTPLWATIALVLTIIVYTYLKTRSLQPPKEKPKKIEWFTYCGMKWKVIIYKDTFELDKIPFCIEHDQQFIYGDKGYRCPGTESQVCESMMPSEPHDEFYSAVNSMVESNIRNGKPLC